MYQIDKPKLKAIALCQKYCTLLPYKRNRMVDIPDDKNEPTKIIKSLNQISFPFFILIATELKIVASTTIANHKFPLVQLSPKPSAKKIKLFDSNTSDPIINITRTTIDTK